MFLSFEVVWKKEFVAKGAGKLGIYEFEWCIVLIFTSLSFSLISSFKVMCWIRLVIDFSIHYCLLFPKRQILDSSKLKEFGDDNF